MSAKRRASLFAIMLFWAPACTAEEGFAGLGAEASGFSAVVPGKTLVFPQDFAAHPGFRTEWWYLTANLKDASGASYGVQWTLFRFGTEAGPERAGWANKDIWMGHAAVTSAADHLFAQTLARGGIGQAGVGAAPFRAWIDNWSFAALDDAVDAGLSRARVSADGPSFRYTLDLATDKPIVLHGDKGFSRKSDRGQASYYFSQPSFAVNGVLAIRGQEVRVSGKAWMDREWSSQPLAADQKGWDWFSLHLSSGENLMLFRLRSASGGNYFAGTWIAPDGTAHALEADDIAFAPISTTNVAERTLPTSWRVQVKSHALEIETKPLNAQSWMATRFPYWEGPISFSGSHLGEGYLEMTGY